MDNYFGRKNSASSLTKMNFTLQLKHFSLKENDAVFNAMLPTLKP